MDKTCATCEYFRQHYEKIGAQYIFLSVGHCAYTRVKLRRASFPACAHYEESTRKSPEEAP